MSDEQVQLQKLKLRRGAGFEPPGLSIEGLGASVNVVYGKNASGKTTLARAIRTVLWPDAAPMADGELTGWLRVGDASWRIDYLRGRTTYQRDGADIEHGPQLIRQEACDRYFLALPDLLAAGGDDFAELIVRESAGGYDVDAAAQALGFSVGALRQRKATRQLRDARQRWREARDEQKDLHNRARELDVLKRDIDAARSAARKAEAVKLAIEFRRVDDERTGLESKLRQFPDVLGEMSGDEHQDLDRLRRRLDDIDDEIGDLTRTIEDCEQRLEANPLDEAPGDDAIPTLEARVDRLDELHRDSDSLQRQLEEARRQQSRAARRITRDADELGDVDAATVDELTELADEWTEVEGRLTGFESLKSLLGDAEFDTDLEELKSGIDLLRRWLSEPETSEEAQASASTFTKVVVIGSAAVVAVAAAVVGLLVHPVGWALVAVAAALGWAAFSLRADTDSTGGEESNRKVYRRDFERLDVDPPQRWNEEDVRRRLTKLVEQWADAAVARNKREFWESRQTDRNQLQKRRDELDERRRQLRRRLGLRLSDPAKTGWLVSQIIEYQRAEDDIAGLKIRQQTIRQQTGEMLNKFNDGVDKLGFAPVEDAAEARGRLSQLREAAQAYASAATELHAAQRERERAEQRRESVEKEINQLFRRLGIDDGDDRAVEQLCAQKPEYDDIDRELIGVRRAADEAEAKLRDHSQFSDDLLEMTVAELETEHEELAHQADELDELENQRRGLEKEIELAKEATDVERRKAQLEARRHELRERRETHYRRAVGAALVDHVREQTRDRNRPRVFHHARQLFSQFTRGRYRLDLDEAGDGPVFRAYDNNKSRGFAIEQLSSGTRVQLLLAVRLAFVECQEQGAVVPMLLDETLANSDDDRARAILKAIEQIAARGRQVFYFTAQRDEVAKWQQFAGDADVDCTFVGLDDGQPAAPSHYSMPPLPADLGAAPAPQGADHEGYGELLGVGEPVGLWTPVSDVHLWYVVEDVQKLYRLLDAGVNRWGQLRQLADDGGLEAVGLEAEAFDAIEARAQAVEAFQRASRIGRGRLVDRRVLEQSGAVSDNFIDDVDELCDRVGGDARRLVDGLRDGDVKRFRSNKADELEQHLVAEGYLDEERPLEADEIWTRVLAGCAQALGDGVVGRSDLRRVLERIGGEERCSPRRGLREEAGVQSGA